MFKRILGISVLTYLAAELVCFVFIKTGYLPAPLPAFFTKHEDTLVFPSAVADINEHWGVWHLPYPLRVPYGCLTLENTPNSYGARDRERPRLSNDTARCIVLGDSYMEGFGIPVEKRASNLLEDSTGIGFLNFACADMGSTQEYLVYKHLASEFIHNAVLVGILPGNDFLNDNVGFDRGQTPMRYKPYWKGSFPDMTIFYHTDSLQHSQLRYEAYRAYKKGLKYKLRYFLENTTCWFNVVYFISQKKGASDLVRGKTIAGEVYSGYYHYSAEDLERLKQSLYRIKQVAGHRRVIAFTIPVATDFVRFNQENKQPPLTGDLVDFCNASGIEYHDLLTAASAEDLDHFRQFYFDCDMHLNEQGNAWMFRQLRPLFPLNESVPAATGRPNNRPSF